MQATLNIRIDKTLKDRGEKVLSEHGISVSEAVRALWSDLADKRDIPDFLKESESSAKKARVRSNLKAFKRTIQLSEKHAGSLRNASDEALDKLLYESMMRDYEALE